MPDALSRAPHVAALEEVPPVSRDAESARARFMRSAQQKEAVTRISKCFFAGCNRSLDVGFLRTVTVEPSFLANVSKVLFEGSDS